MLETIRHRDSAWGPVYTSPEAYGEFDSIWFPSSDNPIPRLILGNEWSMMIYQPEQYGTWATDTERRQFTWNWFHGEKVSKS